MSDIKIGIIGLGYVGLPLAVAFAAKYTVVGFDVNKNRVSALNKANDTTLEVSKAALEKALDDKLTITAEESDLANVNFYIVTVPTPVDSTKNPDLSLLIKASETIGKFLKKGDIVVYESTVYPGATEEDCMPVLAKTSGLVYNEDFFVGYSPERINPGDKKHTVTDILKVTSGSTPAIAQKIDAIYKSIITAGTYLAPSIKVAEAAKVIENAQRDINIAFVNELAKIFAVLAIDTNQVLEAAATKWNFLPFKPGLVGGHCIGVDPYYLIHKAKKMGYTPRLIQAGRALNDSMGAFVAQRLVKLMLQKDIPIKNARVLLAGITIKENVTDIRNSRSVDLFNELESFNMAVDVYDPWADSTILYKETKIKRIEKISMKYDAILIAVAHNVFKGIPFEDFVLEKGIVYDIKALLPVAKSDARL